MIGMTAMPEAKLAREAELPYAIVAMVTDYDCWHEDHGHVTVDQVVKIMHSNAENARKLAMTLAPKLGPNRVASPDGTDTVLDTALITAPEKRDPGVDGEAGCRGGTGVEEMSLVRSIALALCCVILRPTLLLTIFRFLQVGYW